MRKRGRSHVHHLIPATWEDAPVRSPTAYRLLYRSPMFGGLPPVKANGAGLRSRKAMLETLTRHLDMARLTAAASMLAMIGCTGLIDAPAPTKAEIARQKWVDQALPALTNATCLVCHGGAAPRPMVDFLVGADDIAIHDKLMAFDPAVISLDAPQSSRLLNKGQHEGPPLVGNDKSDVLDW